MEEEKKETKPVENKEQKEVVGNKVATEVKKETKKQETSKITNKKSTTVKGVNNATIIGVIAIVIALVAILLAIFFMKDSPKKVIENALGELKTGSYAEQMLLGLAQGEDNFNAEAQKLLFEKLQWKVINVKEEGDKATVEVEITNKDFKTIMGNYMQKALKAAFSGNTNEEEMANYLIEELKNEEVQTITSNQSITLEKRNGKWEIAEEENFINCVLPGLYEAISAFK